MQRVNCGRRLRLIVIGFLALGAAAMSASTAARSTADDASTLARRLSELSQEKARVRKQLRRVKKQQSQVSRQLAHLDARVEAAESQLNQVSARVDVTRVELQQATQEYHQAEARLTEHRDLVAERLVAIYERGEAQPIEVLLESTSFDDLSNRLYLLDQIVDRDAELLDDYDEAQVQAATQRAVVEQRCRDLEVQQGRITEQKQRVSHERGETARKKQTILRDRLAWERALAELEQDSHEIETMLRRLQRTQAGQARLAQPYTGRFRMPVEGRRTSPYGYRNHPILGVRKLHTGIDVAASSGTSIRAAGDGTVIFAGRWGGYGNCVIIDHGGGTATLYGHCSRLGVTQEQKVTQGQVIAYVGSTGLSTGPHLHFEVRRDGRPVDPAPYL
jgi:murein DD-endopeptidase MepM/ murein hydrolase activator NlpD